MTMSASRDFLFIFMFMMPMLSSSSNVDFPLNKEDPKLDDVEIDPEQLGEGDAQLDPVQLSEEDVQLDDAEITRGVPNVVGDYAETKYGAKDCPSGYAGIYDKAECETARSSIPGKRGRLCGVHNWGNIQGGCFSHSNKCIWFNKAPIGRVHGAFSRICKSAGGCPGGWPQIEDVGASTVAIKADDRKACAAKCMASSTCGSFKWNKASSECTINTWAQSTTNETQVEGESYTCKRVFAEMANRSAGCPSHMKHTVVDEQSCKDAGSALGKKWGGASSWNTIPGGCSIHSAGSIYFNSDAGVAKNDFSKVCSSSPPPAGFVAPPTLSTTATTTPSLTSVCTAGVCTKGKWVFYQSSTTEAACKAKCEETRQYVSVPDGIQEDIYSFNQNGRFHDVSKMMSQASRKVKNINYPNSGHFWKDPSGKYWTIRDQFYGRWTGYIEIKTAGKYTFNTRSDDGSRLFINDVKIVENGGWHGMRDKRGDVELTAGKHKFSAEMFEGGGGAGMEWKYKGPDTGNREIIVPHEVLSSSLAGSDIKEPGPKTKEFGMCQAYSYKGDECVLYSSCTELGADKESLVCEDDNSFDWVEPSQFMTCKY